MLKIGDCGSINRAYFVGIKGTGMAALAELMHSKGVDVYGSDTNEIFYTDPILRELGIPYYESFESHHISNPFPDMLIHSAAYSGETNAEIAEAQKQGIPVLTYPEALGLYSAGFDSTGISGVHGKTTTAALAGTLLRGAGVSAQVLAGSAVSSFGGRSTLNLGGKFFVAETCEYRRNFLFFHPQRIVLTSVECDHQDYYSGYDDIRDAFVEYGMLLPHGGDFIYCADDPGACEVAGILKSGKRGINFISYGFKAEADFVIRDYRVENEMIVIKLEGFPGELRVRIPGRHTALNTAAAMALVSLLVKKEFGNEGWNEERREGARKALLEFRGSKRRSEVLGEAARILFMDDYAHHPAAIKSTLEGLKEFYPRRRLVLSFMSHTFSRTASMLKDFAASFEKADVIILHKIYSSAREVYHGGVTGRTLFEETLEKNPGRKNCVFYSEEIEDSCDLLKGILKEGDLFITMGAGDNWKLGAKLFSFYTGKTGSAC